MGVVTIERLQPQQFAGRIGQPASSPFGQHKIYSCPDIARTIAGAAARGEPPEMANGDEKVVQSLLSSGFQCRAILKLPGASKRIAGHEVLDALWGGCESSGLLEQNCLGVGTSESVDFLNVIGPDALFVEAKFLAVNLEKFFLRVPILT